MRVRFPSDEEFIRKIKERDLYNFNRRSYWLRRFENAGNKERVYVNDYTIEHIMPQNGINSEAWIAELGEDYERVHEQYLHTLGNLTLTGYNSEYSDHAFSRKRDMAGGFSESNLRVNKGISQEETWNEAAINRRASRLASEALTVWTSPKLSPEILESYQKPKKEKPQYSIEDHPLLLVEETRILFEATSKAIKALDECVTEEILKYYIAYKAETNFADIEPRSKRLMVALNISLTDLDDPKKLADDISHIGHRGNGNTRVNITSLEDIPYAIGLIRQALEQQL